MGDKITIKLDVRTHQGKKVAKLRESGLVPGVVYGHGLDPIMIQAEYGLVEKVVREAGRHSAVHIKIDSRDRIALIKDIDRDPVKHLIRHVSFHAVKANEVVQAEVPIRLVGQGESEAEKIGLIVLQAIESVEIKAKPADLPEVLEISIANLATVDDKITMSDIKLPKGVEYQDVEQDLDLVVANVYEPAALEAANEAAAGDATDESEVVVEGSEEAVESKGGARDEPKKEEKS